MRLNKESYKDYKKYPERVLQFGEGNFLRAFVDWQIDEMNNKADFNSSVVVVQPIENGLVNILNEQDGLYTLYLQGMKNGKAEKTHKVINSISRGVNPYTNYDSYLEIGENPDLRFVISNTTEAGITFKEEDKLNDSPQSSFPGKLTALLYRRYKTFNGASDKGLIIIPCELIDRNGEKLKENVLKYCELWTLEEGFIKWIEENNTFCCSLVDRIVPGYPRDIINEVTEELGYEDKLVNVGELYHLWVIEGPQWIREELPADKAGLNIKVVDDMTPYRTRKVRILNGSHTAMVPVSYLYGLETVGETVNHEVLSKFVNGLLYEEINKAVDLPEEELVEFADAVVDRFKNPYVNHYLMSIALNSMSKYKTRNLPSVLDYLNKEGKLPKRLVFSLAALIEFYKGKRGQEDINLSDDEDILELYKSLWIKHDGSENSLKNIVTNVLGYEKNWGMDLNKVPNLNEEVTKYLTNIEKVGMKEAIKEVL